MPVIYEGVCKSCGKDFKGFGKFFCDRSCQLEYSKKKRKYNNDNERKKAWASRNKDKVVEAQRKCNKKNWKNYQNNYENKHPGKIRHQKINWYEKNYKPKPITNLSMKAKSAVAKGKLFENFIADKLRKEGIDPHARRTFGSGGGHEKGDIYNCLDLNIECKNTKTFSLSRFWAQTLRDSEKAHTTPILIWHPPNKSLEDSVVVLPLHYFIELAKTRDNAPANFELPPDLKWKVKRMVDATKAVFKELK